MKKLLKNIFLATVAVAVIAFFYNALKTQPILVDATDVSRAPMEVSIEADAIIRVKDVYTISSPIAGHLARSDLEEGQAVVANETVIASIHPLDPPFLDQRTEADLTASIEAARSAVVLSQAELDSASTALELATSEYNRALKLATSSLIAESAIDQSFSQMQLAKSQVARARAEIQLRQAQLSSAEAKLIQPDELDLSNPQAHCCVHLTSPADGVVLKIISRSEQAVSPGSLIAEVGDLRQLEIAADLLSTDATQISEGVVAKVIDWGGNHAFDARVTLVEPSAFTKVSALGIEEQRVNVILDVIDTPEALGHNFRVVVRIPVWRSEQSIQVPIGSLFRTQKQWSVFVIRDRQAIIRHIDVDHLNDTFAEVTTGLEPGEKVIVYPSDLLEDGSRVEIREEAL